MKCSSCGAVLPADSAFCNKCGAAARPPAAASPAAAEPERDVWSGRWSSKDAVGSWILWFLWFAALLAARFYLLGGLPRWADYALAGAAVFPALWLFAKIAVRKLSLRYRLTTHRFFREEGILSRHVSELELIRVDDVSVRQGIVQRLFNIGTVTILSTDASDPRLEIRGIDDPIDVKEKIRRHVRERRARALHMESL